MNSDSIRSILSRIKTGDLSIDEALATMRHYPFQNLGFAKVDHHRSIRKGFPEVIFGAGKTDEQILSIARALYETQQSILVTRISQETYEFLKHSIPDLNYTPLSRCAFFRTSKEKQGRGTILVMAAGTSDIPVAEEASITCEVMGHDVRRLYDVGVAGLHRMLAYYDEITHAEVIVAIAGMEGALPSVVSGMVECPVIGVPTSIGYGASFHGLAALLAMLNSCASGVTVVNIDNGFGAGYAAAMMNRRRNGDQI